jgi:hypothetical protein
MSSDELIKVKTSVSGEGASVELDVRTGLAAVLARLFPTRVARTRAKNLISERILEKIQKGEPLDPADTKYAAEVFGEAEAKWMRRQAIAARASKAIEQGRRALELAPLPENGEAPAESAATTAEDWIDKFWSDAELVSDDMLQEIYARILATEATSPGTCSLRTLRVLRYLDRRAAENFAKLAPAIFNFDWVPRDEKLQEMFGVTYDLLLDLDDAGLVSASALSKNANAERIFVSWGTSVLSLSRSSGLRFNIFSLRPPGRELARVAQIKREPRHFLAVGRWLANQSANIQVEWAEMPNSAWTGPADQLNWRPIPEEEKQSATTIAGESR